MSDYDLKPEPGRNTIKAKYWVNHCEQDVGLIFLSESAAMSTTSYIDIANDTIINDAMNKIGFILGPGSTGSDIMSCQRYANTIITAITDTTITSKSPNNAALCKVDLGMILLPHI